MTIVYETTQYDQMYICGDFNARIANLEDIITAVDDIPIRKYIDSVKAGHWETFLEFVKDARLCIVNGRVTNEYDNYTCVSVRGNSVVDYILTAHENFKMCISCKAELTHDLMECYGCYSMLSHSCKAPDHSMLTVSILNEDNAEILRNECQDREIPENNTLKKYKFGNCPNNFMNSDEWKQKMHEITMRCRSITTSQELNNTYEGFL